MSLKAFRLKKIEKGMKRKRRKQNKKRNNGKWRPTSHLKEKDMFLFHFLKSCFYFLNVRYLPNKTRIKRGEMAHALMAKRWSTL